MISTLVIDDDPRVADIHAAFVAKVPGFAVTGLAYCAQEAYETVCATEPDLLLLDLYLPDEHGLALLHRLHQRGGLQPDAIVITAARDVQSVRAAMQLGALHYVVKPFGFRQLAERLEGYQAMRESMTGLREPSQADVDKLFSLLRTGDSSPSDVSSPASTFPTMSAVLQAVRNSQQQPSASEVAADVGISRATAQRYLAQLVASGLLELELQYGSAGRPSHRYRLRTS